jgi:hypothetical protein
MTGLVLVQFRLIVDCKYIHKYEASLPADVL